MRKLIKIARVLDVLYIGPFLIWLGSQNQFEQAWVSIALIVIGIGAILLNSITLLISNKN